MTLRTQALKRAAMLACVALAFCAPHAASLIAEGSGPALTEGTSGPAAGTPIPAQGESAPAPEAVAIPAPSFLIAEPTPNDNGTHVTVRWPRLPADLEKQAAKAGWSYVVYISVDPSWRWFECGMTRTDGDLVMNPNVSPFYPYRFSDDTDHYFIVSPLNVPGITVHWLAAERQSLDWLQGSQAALQQCESLLADLRKKIAERKAFLDEAARYRPRWARLVNVDDKKTEVVAGYIRSSESTERAMGEAVAAGRDGVLDALARYLMLKALLRAEAENAIQSAGSTDLGDMERRLRNAGEAMPTEGATAERCDDYDRLNYARNMALILKAEKDAPAPDEKIGEEILYRLGDMLRDAHFPYDFAGAPAGDEAKEQPQDAAFEAALKGWHTALARFEREPAPEADKQWTDAQATLDRTESGRQAAIRNRLGARLGAADSSRPERDYVRIEAARLAPVVENCGKRLRDMERDDNRRPYCFRLGLVTPTGQRMKPFSLVATAAARPSAFDVSKLVNFIYALAFTAAVLLMVLYVRRHPDVFVRRIAGFEAVDEAIGRATEMGKPVVFVHGFNSVGDISGIASINILGRLARQVAAYDSDLLVVNNDPLVYSLSQEVVQEAYIEAGRPDAYNPDNVFMLASDQFPYVAAVAGIMSRRKPAANFFMGYFFAESLILAEAGAATGAIQIAGTDSFTQLPFFITTCDYTLMGEELYAASAYLSRNAKLLATLKAQDLGKTVLLAALPAGLVVSNMGLTWMQVVFTAYEKSF